MLVPKAEARIRQYLEFLDRRKYEVAAHLPVETQEAAGTHRGPPKGEWKAVTLPCSYGKEWTTTWFRSRFTLPPRAAGREVFLRAVPNADTLVFIDGVPRGAVNPLHEKVRLAASGNAGQAFEVHLESYAGHPYAGMHPLQPTTVILTLSKSAASYPLRFEAAELLVKNGPVYGLYYDTFVLYELAARLDDDSLRRARILQGLHDALLGVPLSSEGPELAEQAAAARTRIAPLLAAKNGDTTPRIFLVGHAHIDHAWLWPIEETDRKAARTFANMTRYIEEFPEFRFIQSQPAQLDSVRRNYPEVFQAVKEAYARGQWEPNGGMWIEADCNIPSGESLVRQFLVGKQATRDMLGYEGDTLWLPDVFGYAAALPQILAGCEIEFFVTSKINWNDTTRFPYDTFLWRGIDGTGVRTHYITSRVGGYNGKVRLANFFDAWHHVQHKEVQDGLILSVGEGDGGGGTMRADLESARRLSDLEGAPRSEWLKVSDALRKIFSTVTDLPVWQGELYLELHRGTYTTQARTKRFNRTLEFALREAELAHAGLLLAGATGPYPREELLESWKRLLTNQFHDIIPGSSITRVYRDAEESYGVVQATTDRLVRDGRRALASRLLPGADTGLVAFNSLSWPRAGAAVLPWTADLARPCELVSGDGSSPVQVGTALGGEPQAVAMLHVPSVGMAAYRRQELTREAPSAFSVHGDEIETPFYRLRLDAARRIARLQDKESGREVVPDGEVLNRLVSAVDVPVLWDAWDIDADWTSSMVDEDRLESSDVVSHGPVFLQVRSRWKIGERSSLLQDMILYAAERRIDFRTRVEWHESHRLLKAAFPINVLATQARCEVQYGHVLRSTTANLPHDRARFEFCAHKWICVEEAGFGAALLNDCKYGHDVRGSVMRLTLLRSPKAPDPEADMGTQEFTYSLLPYTGSFSVERVVRPAYELNVPLAVMETAGAGSKKGTPPAGSAASASLFAVDSPDVIIEAVKLSEEDPSKLVVRLYEAGGGARRATLSTGGRLSGAWESNMLERKERACAHDQHSVPLELRAFEIKTVILAIAR